MDRRKVLLIVASIVAALGTTLVFLYARSADQRADEKFEAVPTLVAVKQIDQGERVADAQAAGKFELGMVSKAQRLPGALEDLTSLDGQIAQTSIYPGEQIIGSKFAATAASGSSLAIPKGKMAISVNLTDTARVSGFVKPGDQVAIFVTGEVGQTGGTRLLLPEVDVIAVGTTPSLVQGGDDNKHASTENLPRTLLTVGVDQDQAERILFASSKGELAFALLNKDSTVGPSEGVNQSNLFK